MYTMLKVENPWTIWQWKFHTRFLYLLLLFPVCFVFLAKIRLLSVSCCFPLMTMQLFLLIHQVRQLLTFSTNLNCYLLYKLLVNITKKVDPITKSQNCVYKDCCCLKQGAKINITKFQIIRENSLCMTSSQNRIIQERIKVENAFPIDGVFF